MTLQRSDLWSLEQYSQQRPSFRKEVLEHKKNREVNLNKHTRLMFEDEKTIRYQIQEMLRIEKVFEAEGIQEELDAYNPLIPDGHNLKATLMLEYGDVDERRVALEKLTGVERVVWMQVGDAEKVYAIADEDLERENDTKTSSVHFMRFEFSTDMIKQAQAGADLKIGCDHIMLEGAQLTITGATREALLADFSS